MKQYIILMSVLVLALTGCNKQSDEMRESAIRHFSQVFETDGSNKIDTVIFMNAEIPPMVTVGDDANKIINEKFKKFGSVLLLVALTESTKDLEENKDEFIPLFQKSLKPLKEYADSINKGKEPKQNLALVKTHNIENGKTSKFIYILSDDVNFPIKDSIPFTNKVRERIELSSFAGMPMETIMNCPANDLDSINRSLASKESPVIKFLLD